LSVSKSLVDDCTLVSSNRDFWLIDVICFKMEEIVSQFGIVVCTRAGSNVEKFIYESDLLTKYKVTFFYLDSI
jgi:hypothetical protein